MVLQDKAKSFLRWKDRESDSKPTPERLRKAQDGQTQTPGADVAYKSVLPPEAYSGRWDEQQQRAFEKFAYEAGIIPQQKVTINYDATGGGNTHNRLGGIGHQQDWVRDVFERHQWVRRNLLLRSTYVLDAMMGELKDEATGRQYSFEDVGGMIFPHLKDRATRKGIGIGRFIGACEELVALYTERHQLELEQKRVAAMVRDKRNLLERS